jgi:hypothetical protein
MRKLLTFHLIIFALSTLAAAQDKLLTLDEIFSPDAKVRVRFGGMPVFVQWAPDGRSFRQVIGGRLMRVDAASGQAVPYLRVMRWRRRLRGTVSKPRMPSYRQFQ